VTADSDGTARDAVTQRLRGLCDRWRDVGGMSDAEVARLVRNDQIDILIDLAGHTAGNRLAMFAHKPAPVQISYLGYPATTGLKAIDYRITDDIADPPGQTEAFHTERLLRISPGPFLCYQPPAEAPDVAAELPMTRNGFVTFGSFNKASKAGPETIAMWAKVLHAVPNSKLMMKAFGLGGAGSRRRIVESFAAEGIGIDRIQLLESIPATEAHLAQYGQLDIALDTFPYHGTTTTCEALWMGVPVISRVGAMHVSRVGASLLAAVGLAELAAADEQAYVTTAAALSSNPDRLATWRRELRERMKRSHLTDSSAFPEKMRKLLRQAWVSYAIKD